MLRAKSNAKLGRAGYRADTGRGPVVVGSPAGPGLGERRRGTAFVGSVVPVVHLAPVERRDFLFSGPNPGGSSAALGRAGRPAFRMESLRRPAYGAGPRDKHGTSLTGPGARRTGPEGPVSRFLRIRFRAARIARLPSPAACRGKVRPLCGRVADWPATAPVPGVPRQDSRPAGISPREPDSSPLRARSADPAALRGAAAPQTAAGTAGGCRDRSGPRLWRKDAAAARREEEARLELWTGAAGRRKMACWARWPRL